MRRSRHRSLAVLCAAAAIVLFAQGARAEGVSAGAGDWLSGAQRQAAADEYNVRWETHTGLGDAAGSWQAPNRAHGFRAWFSEGGIRLVPRIAAQPSWRWELDLTGYGRGPRVWPVAETMPLTGNNRVEYARGAIVEWYVNEPRGLEQGFTLFAPPEGAGASAASGAAGPGAVRPEETAYLELTLGGTLHASPSPDGQAVDFRAEHGNHVLRYAALRVTDATGRDLPSWIEVLSAPRPRRIRLAFDDRDAVYPLTVDPLVTSPSWTVDGDQAGARFGFAVGTAGDVNCDGYDDVVIGAPWYDNGQVDEGRAYVFFGSGGGLSEDPDWTAEGDQAGARFGFSVGTAGNVDGDTDGCADIIVGAPLYDNGEIDEGRAYVYLGSLAGLSAEPAWTAEGDQANAQFGFAVATAGNVDGDTSGRDDVIVGAPLHDNGETDEGRAYVYLGSLTGLSAEPAWTTEGDQAYANLGHAVGTAGDVNGDGYDDVAVGAPLYDVDTDDDDVVLVGAPLDDGTAIDAGRVRVFHGSDGGPAETAARTFDSAQAHANLGAALGAAGDVNGDGCGDLIVGAFHYGEEEAGEGRAWVFHGAEGSGLETSPAWSVGGDQAWAYFGAAVATAGHVNDDIYDDVIVGAPGYNAELNDAGRLYLFKGSADGLSTFPVWFVNGSQTGAELGAAVGGAGHVNDDVFADVVAGAPYYRYTEQEAGRALVYHGAVAENPQQYCAYLGDAEPVEVEEDVFEPVEVDQDVFTFRGTETELVTVTLSVAGGTGEGGRATLYLMDAMGDDVEVFEVDRSDLPNEVTAVLPASGDYLIAVAQQPDFLILPGLAFEGDYCVTLHSHPGLVGTLEPTDSVEQEESAAAAQPTSIDAESEEGTQPLRRPRDAARRRTSRR